MEWQVREDRECGPCTVCCRELTVDHPSLTKHAGIDCVHCSPGTGCLIHASRPEACSEYFCGWRRLKIADEWRPDRCGIIILYEPPNQAAGVPDGLKFHLFGGLDKIFWLPFVNYAATLIGRNVPVYISVPGPFGHKSNVALLNAWPGMREALATRDFGRITAAVSTAVQSCVESEKQKVEFANAPAT